MAGFYFKPRAHHCRLPQTINRDASLLLISYFRPDQIIKQLVAKIKPANQKPSSFNDPVSNAFQPILKQIQSPFSFGRYSNKTPIRANQLKILIHNN